MSTADWEHVRQRLSKLRQQAGLAHRWAPKADRSGVECACGQSFGNMLDFTQHRNEHMAQASDLAIGRIKTEVEAAHQETPAAHHRRAKCTCGAEMDVGAFAGHVEACKLVAVHEALDAMEARLPPLSEPEERRQTHNAMAGLSGFWYCDCGTLYPTVHDWAQHAKNAGDPRAVIYALRRDTSAKVSTGVSAEGLLSHKQAIGSDPHADQKASQKFPHDGYDQNGFGGVLCGCGLLCGSTVVWAEHAVDAGTPNALGPGGVVASAVVQAQATARAATHNAKLEEGVGSDRHMDWGLYQRQAALAQPTPSYATVRARHEQQQATQETPMTTQTERHPTIDLMFNGGARAGKMVLSAQAMRGVQALARKVADSYLPPEHRAILDTPVGQAIVDMLSPLLLHLLAEQGYLGDGRTSEVVKATAGYAYEAQLFRHGFVLTDVMVKLTTDFASEFAEIKKLGEQITAAEATVDVTPERARVAGTDRAGR